jgi:hypothetical protein
VAAVGLPVGGILALLEVALFAFGVHFLFQLVFISVASGLWSVFAAVVVGRFAPSMSVAVAGIAGIQAGIGVVFGLVSLPVMMLPQFLMVFVAHCLVAGGAVVAAAQSRVGARGDSVWAGLAVGLLGGVVVLLWELGHTGRAVLVLGLVLVVVAAGMLVRRAWHLLVVVPLAVVVAVALGPVYEFVPSVLGDMFPVLAG